MAETRTDKFHWITALWLVFFAGLAVAPPITEIHKQLTLLAFAIFQLFEGRLVAWRPGRGRSYSVLIKILLATLLLGHTGEVGINSAYYPIYFLPVITAAIYFGPLGTILWTALASLCYGFYLLPAILLEGYEIPPSGYGILGIRILFFFLAGILVNLFVVENRRQVQRYQVLSENLAESNRQLLQAQAEARRSERLAALGQLSAGLAHELRNPLGIIKGSAEMLNQKLAVSQPVAGELAGNIYSEVNRMNALVGRFLDFARPSHLDPRPIDIAPVVERSLDAAKHQYPDAKIAVERKFSAAAPDVMADEQLCEQLFLNLVLNAYEAMSENGSAAGRLLITIEPENRQNRIGAAVEIEDTGPGVPDEIREQIFNPFVTAKKKGGVGLGLSIVAKIVDDHGGSIVLKSEAGRGARFRVFLPAAK